uniref:EF-hand domain-containing protein n=1 Tax=Oryza punctata TaxID=4537 RepID=A0A0E0MCD2_ORYPU
MPCSHTYHQLCILGDRSCRVCHPAAPPSTEEKPEAPRTTQNLLVHMTKVFLPLFRPLNFILNDKHNTHSICRSEHSETKARTELTHGDVALVMAALGLRFNAEGNERSSVEDEALVLLEEKQASWEELEEAFSVFDGDGDGFISPLEMQNVMRRLGLQHDTGHDECERMLKVFDRDGDGMINFDEFKVMMQGVI